MPRVKLFDETEVLEKAMNLFWEKGYYATSIQDLVNHLGVNRASLYDTYGGKKELFEQAFAHYRGRNIRSIRAFMDREQDVKTGFRRLFTMAIEESGSDQGCKGCFVVNTTIEFIPNEEEFAEQIIENRKQFEQLFRDYLERGVERGQIPPGKDLSAIATLFFTFYNGLKVVTKVAFDATIFSTSVDALLSVLDGV